MTRLVLVAGAILLLATGNAEAGQNLGRTAWATAPGTGPESELTSFPVIVHLDSSVVSNQIAIHLKWFPFDPDGGCYQLVSAPRSASSGWALSEPPGAAFEGDSTYTWTTHFPLAAAKTEVLFWMLRLPCEVSEAGRVVLASVVVRDSLGVIDTLTVASDTLNVGRAGDDSVFSAPDPTLVATPPPGLSLSVTPSPATTEARIAFKLGEVRPFGLAVFDVGGRLIRRLGAVTDADGLGARSWDLRDASGARVAQGIYFVRLATTRGSASHRIVVTK